MPVKQAGKPLKYSTYFNPALPLTLKPPFTRVSLPYSCQSSPQSAAHGTMRMEIRGFEPLTYGLQSRRSSQLSYIPVPSYCNPLPSNSNRLANINHIKKEQKERMKKKGSIVYSCVLQEEELKTNTIN